MGAVRYRFRAELRTRWRSWLALALLVGLASGAVIALAAGARRTDTAYSRFLRAHNAYDVLVINNPGQIGGLGGGTALLDLDEVRELPAVADAAPVSTFFVTLGAGIGAFVTPDDYVGTELNEFDMLEGRPFDPENPDDAVVSFTLADQYGLGIGDELDIVPPAFLELYESLPPDVELEPDEAEYVRAVEAVLELLPDGKATIVGIEASPGEFPPQIEGSGRYLVHMSPALYPVRGELAGLSEGGDSLLIRLEHGARDTDVFLDGLEAIAEGDVPDIVVAEEINDSAQRSFGTQALALWLLALLTAVAGVLVIGQLLARLTSIESADNPVLGAMGASPAQRAALALLRAAAIGAVAAVVAVVLALVLSPLFPTGLAGTAEPDPGVRVDGSAFVLGALGVLAAVVALAAWPAWRASRSVATDGSARTARVSVVGRALSRGGIPVPVGAGVRMALEPGRGRSSVPVRTSMAGVALGIVTLVAALTFGASLAHLLSTPELYGHTWDVELTTYDETLIEIGVPVLEADDRVEAIARADLRFPFTVDGEAVDGIVLETLTGELTPAILEGRVPAAPDEIALGTKTMRSFDVDVGDTVDVGIRATGRDLVRMEIVGRAVFPVFAEAGSLGDGVFADMSATELLLGERLPDFDTGLLLRLGSSDEVAPVVEDVRTAIGVEAELFVIQQGAPTDIVNFGRVEATPYLLGGILAALSTATLAYLLSSAIRRRRRDLAILKTLGFERRQVRATVGWQATALVVVALVIGVPLGLAAGRFVWDLFADELGVVSEPAMPWLGVAIVVPAAVLVANLVAAVPAAIAARTKPAVVLRSE